jgi:hypothetical protein
MGATKATKPQPIQLTGIPMFRLCRQLVEAAHDPARALHVCGDVLALIVRRMEEGDRLRKGDNG